MTLPGVSAKLYFFLQVIQNCLQLEPRVLSNFEFTYTSAGNLHTQVLANSIADLPIRGKYIPLGAVHKLR